MLSITVPANEFWDAKKREFINTKETKLQLEHSLISISKWESKFHVPFLDDKRKMTSEETMYYIKCMTLTQNVPDYIYELLTQEDIDKIVAYIEDPMTASWFSDDKKGGPPRRREILTSEVLYYDMVALQIPFQCEKWHLNRLITLIKVCNAKNNPKKKRSTNQLIKDYKALNDARRRASGSKG